MIFKILIFNIKLLLENNGSNNLFYFREPGVFKLRLFQTS